MILESPSVSANESLPYNDSSLQYRCEEGSEPVEGDLQRSCSISGVWSGEEPECKGEISATVGVCDTLFGHKPCFDGLDKKYSCFRYLHSHISSSL